VKHTPEQVKQQPIPLKVYRVRSIELIADYRSIGEGQGGSREDTMFYGRGAEI
jgi:hypothetical protein